MDESILNTIKQGIGDISTDTAFDPQLIMFINGVFSELFQLGVEKDKKQIRITSVTETWGEFISNDDNLDMIQTYITLKTKLRFDPPQNSFLVSAIKEDIAELGWRINALADKAPISVDPTHAFGGN